MPSPLEIFLAAQDWPLLQRVNHWTVKLDEQDKELVRLRLRARDGEFYTVQLQCDGYPVQAPSVLFVNEGHSCQDRRAWPRGQGEFHGVVKLPPDCFLCTPLTREGLAHHAEWRGRADAWRSTSTLKDLFNYLHRLLNGRDYIGRAQ